jgi:hypothetical protein
MVKHPLERVWILMRDDLPKLADQIDDIERIRVESVRRNHDVHRIVNIWEASVQLPLNVANHLDANLFSWTDYAEWYDSKQECHWHIKHHYFRDSFNCSGVTQFLPAMGGRGTRITFRGTFELNRKKIPKILSVLEDPALIMIESMLIKLIPKNFQKIATAIGNHLTISGSDSIGPGSPRDGKGLDVSPGGSKPL